MRIISLILALCPLALHATVMGSSGATTRYFTVWQVNQEYAPDGLSRPDHPAEIASHWRAFLRAYRAIGRTPAARQALAEKPLDISADYHARQTLAVRLQPYGISAHVIARQPTHVYTLQLAAYRDPANVRRFIGRLVGKVKYRGDATIRIYDETPKAFHFLYGSELTYKAEPLYLTSSGNLTRVRYGLYAGRADACRDAAVFERRYGITPYVTRTQLTRDLVDRLLFAPVPGYYAR